MIIPLLLTLTPVWDVVLPAAPTWATPSGAVGDEDEDDEDEKEPERLALVGGDVHTITSASLRGATVLCEDGKITKIGYDLDLPDGTVVHDVSGLRVYPGLVAVSSSVHGTSSSNPKESADPFSSNIVLALASGVTATGVGNHVVKLTRGELTGYEFARDVLVPITFGAGKPATKRKVREGFAKAKEYLGKLQAWEAIRSKDKEAKEPKATGVNRSYVALLRGEKTARFRSSDAEDLQAVAALIYDYPMPAVIIGAVEGWTVAEDIGRSGAKVVVTPRAKSQPDENTSRPSGSSIRNASILDGAGVEIAVLPPNTSIDRSGLAGRDMLTYALSAAFAMRGGLGEDAALRSITLTPARILGVADRIGSLEPGKDADLLVTDGDILHYRTFVQAAFVNGKLVYDKNEETYFSHIRPIDRPEPTVVGAEEEEEEEAVEEEKAEEEDKDKKKDDEN